MQAAIDAEVEANFRVRQIWTDLLVRISVIILREGTRLKSREGAPPTFMFIADGAPDYQIPTIQIVCEILGDQLTVTAGFVWQEGDHDLDDEDDANRQ